MVRENTIWFEMDQETSDSHVSDVSLLLALLKVTNGRPYICGDFRGPQEMNATK